MATMSMVRRADTGHAPTSAPADMHGAMTKRQVKLWLAGDGKPLGATRARENTAPQHSCGWDTSGPAELTLAERCALVRQRAADSMAARRAACISGAAFVVRR